MATRPWVTPSEVIEYTDLASVKNRSDAKLAIDITRAEQYVVNYTHNTFAEAESIPENVRIAVILIAEYYAQNAALAAKAGVYKSESFDDYSYTLSEPQALDLGLLGLGALLDEFVVSGTGGNVNMRMFKL